MCPYIQKRKISVNHDNDKCDSRRRNKWSHYYGDRRYKKLRDWFIQEHPICADCAIEGRSVPAEEVHHKIPFSFFTEEKDRIVALLDPDNLISLCKECHMKRHKSLSRPNNFEETDYYYKIHCTN